MGMRCEYVEALRKLMSSSGLPAQKLKIEKVDVHERGLVALNNVRKLEKLLFVPPSFVITPNCGWERGESSVRGASFSSLNQDNMLNGGHLDINSVQFFSDSLRDRLKQTMLNQELAFMGQVLELHRLYRIQIGMADDIKQRGSYNYDSHIGGVNPSPVNMNHQVKCSMRDLQCSTSGLKKKPLDLQLSADEFICQSANDLSGKGALGGFAIQSSQDTVAFDLNISLSTDEVTGKKGVGHRSWMGRRTCGPPPEIIDLEDPNLRFSNNDADPGLPPNSCFKDKRKLESFIRDDKYNLRSFSKNRTRHVSHGTTSSRPFNDVCLTSQRQTSSKSGFSGDFMTPDASVPHGGDLLDLNKIPLEDLSYFTNSHSGVVNPVATAFSNIITEKVYSQTAAVSSISPHSRRASNVNHCADTPDVLVNNVKLGAAQNFTETTGNKLSRGDTPKDKGNIIYIDLDSDSGEELCSNGDPKFESVGSTSKLSNVLSGEELCSSGEDLKVESLGSTSKLSNVLSGEELCSRADPKIENVGSTSKLPNVLSCEIEIDVVGGEVHVERDPNPLGLLHCGQNLVAAEQRSGHKLSNSSESKCMIDPQTCSVKTMQSGFNGRDSNFSSDESQMVDMGPAAAYSVVLGHGSSESPDSNILGSNNKESEVDGAVQAAAGLLVQLSLEEEANYLDGSAKVNSKVFQSKEHDQPQCSIDSYEAMVLNAKECGPDDYCVSSNAFVVDVSETKDSRYKLKRGTRMKDFQKDILSSLSTLSRQEIREDINIFEGVIKSREYKKMRAKMGADEGDWCRPTRNKRSRVSRR